METSQRPTREITTKGGHRVVLKTYATGRESAEIQAVFMRSAKYHLEGNEMKMDGFDPSVTIEANGKSFELLVVSVDGETDDIENRVYNLPTEDCDDVLAAIEEATGKKKTE